MASALPVEVNSPSDAPQSVQTVSSSSRILIPLPQHTYTEKSERDFSRMLRYYKIRSEYERYGIPLGEEMLIPDFYLPVEDIFIELTTGRSDSRSNKNRKMRMAVEAGYPVRAITNSLFGYFCEQYKSDKKSGNKRLDLAKFLKLPGELENGAFYIARGLSTLTPAFA